MSARDELIDGLCEEGAYSAASAIYLADAYRDEVLREAAAAIRRRGVNYFRRVGTIADSIDPDKETR